MAVMRWDPFQETDDLFNQFFRTFAARPAAGSESARVETWRPAATISETEDEYLIRAELPEVSKQDIELSVDDGVLKITGERKFEKKHEDEKVHRVESFYGKFSRSFGLPDDVDAEKISAESKDGVLVVRLPKSKKAAPTPKKIRIQ
jgi:HSP20 family protein